MTQPYMSLSEATQAFGISKRTIERKVAAGEIGRDQIRFEGGKRLFLVAELIRVFWPPKAAPAPQIDAPGSSEADILRDELIEELRERARKAEAREQAECDRAERYERELAELRQRHDDLTTRLLPAPNGRPGLFRRLFGG